MWFATAKKFKVHIFCGLFRIYELYDGKRNVIYRTDGQLWLLEHDAMPLMYSSAYHKYGTMGRIGSTKLVLPKWHKYGTYNRHFRVNMWLMTSSKNL